MSADLITPGWGYIGKMPAKGDFVKSGLSQAFCNRWHDWLQAIIAVSKEQLGDIWVDCFLTSPIWHFALDASYMEDSTYIGTLIPSVDSTGRYFFFTVVRPVSGKAIQYWVQSDWTRDSEELALAVLEDDFIFDSWNNEMKHKNSSNLPLKAQEETGKVELIYESQFSTVFQNLVKGKENALLNYLVGEQQRTPCVWWTDGSEHIESCMFISKGLPAIGQFSAMLDGLWDKWGW